ncbi:MAG TPA: vWA domain-containing protein [Polyangiaceae bacterium]|nr:vWA domain-containing protein [Polyangiaceae bacterium]
MIAGAIAIDGGGCGSSGDRPNALGDFGTADASVDGSQTFQSSGPVPLSCNLGPDGGVCACDDQPLLGDPPNLYLILDRSGSMSTDGKWSTVADVIEKLVIDLGPRAVVGVTVFPDPYSDDTCAPGAEIYPPTRGDAPAGQAGSSEVRLVKTLADILANGGTPTAATIEAVTPRIRGLSGKTYVILATDGGPNCNPDATCDASQCELNIESPNTPIQSICPPGGPPNCCADPAYGDATSCLDAQPTIDAVTALASDGIPVYIVGVPGSAPYAALLNQLAIAGNTARVPPADAGVDGGAGAVDGATQYYDVQTTDQSAFESAIFSIAAAITGTCTLTLSAVPPDPSQVNVFLDEQVLPQQGADGWTLDGQTVTLLGQSCAKVKAGDVLDVRVVAGCPTLQR